MNNLLGLAISLSLAGEGGDYDSAAAADSTSNVLAAFKPDEG